MIVKSITVYVRPGHRAEYLAAQQIWNTEIAGAPGYLGCSCGSTPEEPDIVRVWIRWRSRADLNRFMAEDHDRIAALAKADAHYERIEVRILDEALSDGALPVATNEAAQIQWTSEAFRVTATLRTAIRAKLFDRLAKSPQTADELARTIGGDPQSWNHLLRALSALGLVDGADVAPYHNTPLTARLLVSTSPQYQGAMILHSSQPEYVLRAFAFGENIGLEADVPADTARHELFISAMAATAAAGQTEALVAAVDLSDGTRLIDVGGATGFYTMALCRAYPRLHALILDLPETLPLAEAAIARAGLTDRVRIVAHDYRSGSLPESADVVLISDILRGEREDDIARVLEHAFNGLAPGGRLVVTDVFPKSGSDDIASLRAAMFGIHLPRGMNPSAEQMRKLIARAGFEAIESREIAPRVMMNGLIEARRP